MPRIRKKSKLERINEQMKWMEKCGGGLAGYIENYGDPGITERWSGNGGTAIYRADCTELERLKSL